MIIPKILLHICCAPCSLSVIKILEKKNFSITGFWYNPNIWPKDEYERRLEALEQYEKKKNLSIIYDTYWAPKLDFDVSPRPCMQERGEPDKRCPFCYEERLLKTAMTAERLNFDFFTTTLLISPYQKHEVIRSLGEDISTDFGVNFYYEDFRTLFYHNREEYRALNLYHQHYCGCKASIKEAEETRKKAKS